MPNPNPLSNLRMEFPWMSAIQDTRGMPNYDPGMRSIRILAWLWLLLAPVAASCQVVSARWMALHDNAVGRGVMAAAQTPDGYLWVGTTEGLKRFDGLEWRGLGESGDDRRSVSDLLVDPQGRLWGASNDALLRLEAGRVVEISRIGMPGASIKRLRWIHGALYLATTVGIYRYSADRGLVLLSGSGNMGFFDVAPDPGGAGLLAGAFDGLHRWNGKAWQHEPGSTPNPLVIAMARDAGGRLWLGGYTMRPLLANGLEGPAEGPAQRIRRVAVLSNGELWVGTNSDGLYIRDSQGRWRRGDRHLRGESINAIFEDNERNVWVSTTGSGLHRFALIGNEVTDFDDGLPTKLLASVASDGEGGFWLATYGSGLVHVNGLREVRRVETPCGDMLLSLAWQPFDTLWLGGEGGLCRLRGGRVEKLPGLVGVMSLAMGHDGGLWVFNRSEVRLMRDGRTISRIPRPDDGDGAIMFGMQDAGDGGVWLASGSGVARVGPWGWRDVDRHGEVEALLASEASHAWLLQRGQLVLLEADGTRHAIPSMPGTWLLWIDAAGDLWQIGRSGAARTNARALRAALESGRAPPRWESFDEADGHGAVQPSGVGPPSIVALPEGQVAYVALGQLRVGSLSPPGRPYSIVHVDVVAVSAPGLPTVADGQQLPPGQRSLQIRYTAANLREPQALRFRYRLLPADTAWSAWTGERSLNLAQLPSGRHVFEVQAWLPGREVSAPARFRFTILPFWYETWWARILGVVVLMVLATLATLLALRVRMRRLIEHKHELEQQVEERTRKLEKANRQLEELANTDALTGLANRRVFMEASDQEWRRMRREGGSLALLMIDIDHFKAYNDGYGHAAGDGVLRRVAGALAASVQRPGELVARYGGEEFVALLPNAGRKEASVVGERMRENVAALAIAHAGNDGFRVVTVSVGAATSMPADGSIDAVQARADAALYAAKSSGRNRVHLDNNT